MKRLLLIWPRLTLSSLCALVAAGAFAQPTDMGGYSSMRIDSVGVLEGGFDGTISRMAEGVAITLLSEAADMKDLPIKAGSMSFDWPAGESTPKSIIMEGNVEIDHPQGHVTAQRAEWNFDAGTLTFSGNPIMRNEQLKEMRGDRMVLNFKNNSFQVHGAKIKEVPLGGMGNVGGSGGGGAQVISDSEVTDWPGLIATIKKEAAAAGASPGKQIVTGLPQKDQANLNAASVELLVQNKSEVLKGLNHVLSQNSFYNEAAWSGKNVPQEAADLIAKQGRSAAETQRMNRLLLHAAYPQYVTAP